MFDAMRKRKLLVSDFFAYLELIAKKYDVKYHFPTSSTVSIIRLISVGIFERTIEIPSDLDDFDTFKLFIAKEFELPLHDCAEPINN